MTSAASQVATLIAKDLRIEARSRQTIGLVIVLGILVVVVLGLGLGQNSSFAATSVLWVAYLFAGVLCFEKTMGIERADAAMAGLLMAPLDRGLLFVAKLVTNLILMALVACVVTPAGVLFFGFDLSATPWAFVLVMGLSMIGFAAIGTLFSAVVSSSRLAGGLLALVVFPLALPLVISSTQLMLRVFRDGQSLGGSGLAVLLAFDVIFLVASWLLFEVVLEP
jgi:heme exporter protein B